MLGQYAEELSVSTRSRGFYEITREVGEVVFATHNEASYHGFKDLCGPHYHHATLMGFNEPLRWEGTIRRMVHVPFGPLHRTYPYLLRRWYENPIATMR